MTTGADIHFALAFDKAALIGAHVTMRTVLDHLNPANRAYFHCFGPPLPAEDIACLRKTLDGSRRDYAIRFIDMSASRFLHMKWLGGFTTYLRLIIPPLCDVERIIYLDSDLLVFTDLGSLFYTHLDSCVMGAVSWHKRGISNDKHFFSEVGLDTSKPYFNAGVLLIDAIRWKEENITQRCLELGDRYGKSLPTADQTILNVVFNDAFSLLPRKYNTPVAPGRAPLSAEIYSDRVIHLVSHPKPWDLFGWLNGQYSLYRQEFAKTSLRSQMARRHFRDVWRTLRWSRAYWNCVRQRLSGR